MRCRYMSIFFCNATATTGIYTLSLHDALPISGALEAGAGPGSAGAAGAAGGAAAAPARSEEHTSELQSQSNLVCRLLLEKKKKERKLTAKFHSMRGRMQPAYHRLEHDLQMQTA